MKNIYIGNLQVTKLEGAIYNLCVNPISDATTYEVLSCLLGEDPAQYHKRTYVIEDLSDLYNEDAWNIRSERQTLLRNKLYDRVIKNLSKQYNVPLLQATPLEKKKYRIYGDYPVILNLNIEKDNKTNFQSLLKTD